MSKKEKTAKKEVVKKEVVKKEVVKKEFGSVNGLKIVNVTDVKFLGGVKMKKIDYENRTTQHKTAEELKAMTD